MGTVKQNLPQGSSRNKIDYLAEVMDNAGSVIDGLKAELDALGGAPASGGDSGLLASALVGFESFNMLSETHIDHVPTACIDSFGWTINEDLLTGFGNEFSFANYCSLMGFSASERGTFLLSVSLMLEVELAEAPDCKMLAVLVGNGGVQPIFAPVVWDAASGKAYATIQGECQTTMPEPYGGDNGGDNENVWLPMSFVPISNDSPGLNLKSNSMKCFGRISLLAFDKKDIDE
ncbi:hypothetical protein CSW98_14105 [Vibrio sp. HA2012]|uniref:hypothetical protein n=1 Tax=Vibrio sp. HA2012 TaxID=1971595 RepID=UPI000C2BAE4A|nr:hypothetical protein [Vibrio sp. HA2012]PJC85706.1 hypothetical protein CSW98_14105 [Vibrio sp. HA2012]